MSNIIVGRELTFIPTDRDTSDFRQIYQKERLKTLSTTNEPTFKTLMRVMHGAKLYPKININILKDDFKRIIEPHLPMNWVMEETEQELSKWRFLPSGTPILLVRPASCNNKDFLGFAREETNVFVLSGWYQTGLFDLGFITKAKPPETPQGYWAEDYQAQLKHEIINYKGNEVVCSLEEEFANYDKFVTDVEKTCIEWKGKNNE